MRPLLVANYDYFLGGGETGLLLLAAGLRARGHSPLVAVPGDGPLCRQLDGQPIAGTVPAGALDLRRLARECDLIHCFSSRAALMACLAGSGRPVILHALIPDPNPYDAVLHHLVQRVLCNSHATARRFGSAPVDVVYNGVPRPANPVQRLPLRPGRRTIAIVGHTSPRKGQLDALPALREVLAKREDVDVAMLGRVLGPVGAALRDAADASGSRIRLFGFVPDAADHLGEFSLVVVPSRSEGFGRVAVEAMRAGTPVLATRVEGLVEALQGLRDPWLPDAKDAWAERILRELDAPTHSASELQLACDRFDPERYLSDILAHYRSLLAFDPAMTARSECEGK